MRSIVIQMLLLAVALGAVASSPLPAFAQAPTLLTRWGSAGSGNGHFLSPRGIAVNSSGEVLVLDSETGRIQRFTPSGAWLGSWGALGSGHGLFTTPEAIALAPNGDVFVCDSYTTRVSRFTSGGTFILDWVVGEMPGGIAVDADGNVYVLRAQDGLVHKYTADGQPLRQWGSLGTPTTRMDAYMGLAIAPEGYVVVADYLSRTIQTFTPDGVLIASWHGQFLYGGGIAVDAAGNVYVGDIYTDNVFEYSRAGALVRRWSVPGNFTFPTPGVTGLALDAAGRLFVVGNAVCNVAVYDVGGSATPVSGTTWGALKALYR